MNIKLFLLLIALSVILAQPISAQEIKAKKNKTCKCAEYVKNRFGIARLNNSELKKNGFVKKSTPAVGDIVIFKSTYGDGVNTSRGHAGVIYSIIYNHENKCYKITVRGANQKGLLPNEYESEWGCNNVSNNFTTYVTSSNQKKLKYWRLKKK